MQRLCKSINRNELNQVYVRKGYIAYFKELNKPYYSKKKKISSILVAPLMEVPKLDYDKRKKARRIELGLL
jgi:hypothetical protein